VQGAATATAPLYLPAAQAVHDAALPTLKVPPGHCTAVGLVLPSGQAYPALQLPLQAGESRPSRAPNVPPGHKAVQPASVSPGLAPY
jgi:hypothetical protein